MYDISSYENIYIPAPDEATGLIEQFDGYFRLEDTTVDVVRSRLLDPKEYWGGAYGVASDTQVLKQADVVAMRGFAGIDISDGTLKCNPNLPSKWKKMSFKLIFKGELYTISISGKEAKIEKV